MAAIVLPPPSFPRLGDLRPRLGGTGRSAPARGAVAPPVAVRRPSAATYRRRRLAALTLALTVLVALWFAVGALTSIVTGATGTVAAAGSTAGEVAPVPVAAVPVAGHVYVVKAGDTLWDIARSLQPEGDIRPLVDRLAERNGGSRLDAGQRLSLDGLVS